MRATLAGCRQTPRRGSTSCGGRARAPSRTVEYADGRHAARRRGTRAERSVLLVVRGKVAAPDLEERARHVVAGVVIRASLVVRQGESLPVAVDQAVRRVG